MQNRECDILWCRIACFALLRVVRGMDYFNEDGNGQCGAWVVGKKGAQNKISLMQLNHLPNFFQRQFLAKHC